MRNTRGSFTLDQLLDTKRAEKPSPDFWSEFNNELRLKQRRLLQNQPIETLRLEIALWHRFRKFGALCAAAASCGVVGFIVMQSIAPAVITSSAYVGESVQPSAPGSHPNFDVEQRAPLTVANRASSKTEFIEVPVADLQSATRSPSIEQEPKAIAVLASNSRAAVSPANFEGFTLTIQTPFNTLNIDDSIEFNAEKKLTATMMEKYIHPLSDRGLKYVQYVSNKTDPLNRVSAMALESNFFNVASRKDAKLNTLSLRF